MCDCIERVNKSLAEHNTCLSEVSMVNFQTGGVRQSLTIGTSKLERKKGKAKIVLPSYCPFCGEHIEKKYEGEKSHTIAAVASLA